jgi:hypothetical protein
MTETVQLALVASIAPTIAALAGLAVSLGNRWRANETKALMVETKAAQVETLKKVDAVDVKAVEIHALTNSANSKLMADLGVANEKILGLEKLFAQLLEAKKETALASAALLEAAIAAPAPEVTAALIANTAQQAALTESLEHDRRNRKTAALALAAAQAEQAFTLAEAQRAGRPVEDGPPRDLA